MSVQRLLQRKSILSSTKQELMINDPSLAKCVMSSLSVTQTTTITWECINQRKKQQDCLSVKSVTMKPIKNRTWIGTFWRCTMKRKIPTNPKTDLVLTVENLSCNKGILQDTRRYTEKETRTTLLSPQVFALFDLFPYFLSPPQVRFNSLSRGWDGALTLELMRKKEKKGPQSSPMQRMLWNF